MVLEVNDRLPEYELNLDVTEPARDWLAENGFTPEFGARPLRRTVQMEVEDRLSDSLLSGEFKAGDDILVDVIDNKISLEHHTHSVAADNHIEDGEEEDELEALPLL